MSAMTFKQNFDQKKVYTFSQLNEFLTDLENTKDDWCDANRYSHYLNVPASFDIETTSVTLEGGLNSEPIKYATMYIWQFGINGVVIYGREWNEFKTLLQVLTKYYDLTGGNHMIIYVHNLGFEFQFMKHHFKWDNVFAIKNRRPVYAITGGIEFRCSYFLSNYSLEYLGDNLLHKYPVRKLTGNLDYSLPRHSKTELTENELEYAFNDVRVVMAYIQEKIEQDGSIAEIPLTNTGYVRNYCRQECFFEGCETEADRKRTMLNYRALMKSLIITEEREYNQMRRAFMGGFTHASAIWSNNPNGPIANVGSADLTSSYPYVMCAQYFPMTRGEYIGTILKESLFRHYLEKYCCLFDIEFKHLKPKVTYENYLSSSHCAMEGKYSLNNGRVIEADLLRTTITELDYDIISQLYTWESYRVTNLMVYKRGYLPKALILSMLKLYQDKTTLKGIEGKEVEYMVSKNMINAGFGMMVTAIIRNDFTFIDEWTKTVVDAGEQIESYNKNWNRFLFYGWGVWVTAHARHNLFSAILEFGEDYVYSDTDSIKGINFDTHLPYFNKYNQGVLKNLLDMCNHYKIDFKMCCPEDKKGKKHMLGYWDIEKGYKLFKTIGAKRYMYTYHDGFTTFTISGVNKKFAMPYLIARFNNIPFDSEEFKKIQYAYSGRPEHQEYVSWLLEQNYDYNQIFSYFNDGFYIPPEYTGKLTMTYIDFPQSNVLVDYQGKAYPFHEKSCLHAEQQSYYLSMVCDYVKFLRGVQYVEET